MQCFKWKTRQCEVGADICELKGRSKYNRDIINIDQSATLFSPGFEKLEKLTDQTFGKSFFCLYNVSLTCPGRRSVVIKSTEKTNWARSQQNPTCDSYVAFVANEGNRRANEADTFCGEADFRTILDTDSFLAVMWTTQERNSGIFEFDVTCNEESVFDAPCGEGSDRELKPTPTTMATTEEI